MFLSKKFCGLSEHLYCFLISEAAQEFIDELKTRFPSQGVMDALGIVYPQYWRDSQAAERSFRKHLDVLKSYYG
jgi:hypothetical protein